MIRKLSMALSLMTGGFLVVFFGTLVIQALPNFTAKGWEILAETHWHFHTHAFGGLSMIYGTVVVAVLATLISFPIGLGSALFASEYLRGKPRAFVKVSIELLAGIPSVVYGLLGVLYVRDWVYQATAPFGAVSGDSLLTAGILLAVMVLPTLMTLSDDVLRCVSKSSRETALALGLSKRETILSVVLPQARPGIGGATILALGRAIGETIAVFLVVGRSDQPIDSNVFSLRPWLAAGQTLTTKLGGSESAIAYGDSRHWSALMALALILWVGVGAMTYLSHRWIHS